MPIQILPPQLANQIAAGEVVERPASVVKELVENSLDAGATHIEIDIEKGGCKLIRVRDNGSGIAEQELTLALSRHATSKISQLDDLEQIVSLGFRGEALASISSVSRLTLTSRPQQQQNAWQAQAAGRDMQVEVRPAAHPPGTSIEVLDLFFNTPARRKFLRTDKTEFGHIDELIKRLALSRYDVSWQLSHNGQIVRRLKTADTETLRQKRVATLCGRAFANDAAFIENSYGDVRLWGWLLQPQACSSASHPCQYSYVNGRIMRDKLLNHAIRQAYGKRLSAEQQPAFVLYLEVNPRQVDVNVHPAKHEVRFHQARLIHDFVVSALSDALGQLEAEPSETTQINVLARGNAENAEETSVRQHAITASDAATDIAAYQQATFKPQYVAEASQHNRYTGMRQSSGNQAHSYSGSYSDSARPTHGRVKSELSFWQQRALPNGQSVPATHQDAITELDTLPVRQQSAADDANTSSDSAALIVRNRYLVRHHKKELMLIDLVRTLAKCSLQAEPARLLLPCRLAVNAEQKNVLTIRARALSQYGFDMLLAESTLIIRAVPQWLRQTAIAQWLPQWLATLGVQPDQDLQTGLLSMLLTANWLPASVLVSYCQSVLAQPANWVAAPLLLDDCIALLEGSSEHV